MKAAAFAVETADTLEAARAAAGRDGARIVAGGQSLGPMLNLRAARPESLTPVARLAELGGASEDAGFVTLGAAVTHAAIEDGRTPDVCGGALRRIAAGIAYRAVRNRGTIGGSLCHADPAADWLTTLTALDASVVIEGAGGRREAKLRGFVLGAYRVALEAGEIVCAVRIPKPSAAARFGYFKFCRKPGEFAHAMAAVLVKGGRRRAAIGATGGAPMVFEGEAVCSEGLRAAGLGGAALAMQSAALARALAEAGGMISLVVNGETRRISAPPRTHLADALREELLLTATHIGCEHGVCGACTVLIDGEPARSCLTFPALCEGADVRTLEGLEDDPVIVALRAAFKAEHALQCGYCTPGMLVSARDIVRRLPEADEARVRLELAGNLCRCTGYQGIVRAILRVLADPPAAPVEAPAAVVVRAAAAAPVRAALRPGGTRLRLRQGFALAPEALWTALQDPAFLVGCVPGAVLTRREGEHLSGELRAGLGAIRTRFLGEGRLSYDAAARRGVLEGEGRDGLSATRASGRLTFRVVPAASGSALEVEADYSLRGPLAQLARPGIVAAFAEALIGDFARRLEVALGGTAAPTGWRAAWRWLAAKVLRRHD